jgi:hypothetical protein
MAEKAYIEKSQAYKAMVSFIYPTSAVVQKALHQVISDIPATDVEPVRHGEWITDNDGLPICSECEEVALQRVFIKLPEKIVDLQMVKSQRCPHCGAKMDGRNNNG